MIFISGIHGVGKSYFAKRLKEECGINTYSASLLITNYTGYNFQPDKKVDNISKNQELLIAALKEKATEGTDFLLDGHFCLLDTNNKVTRIELNTFVNLSPHAILLLTELPEVIAERRRKRDGVNIDIDATAQFQNEEIIYAKEVAGILNVPIFISSGSADVDNAINFIMQII